MIKQIMPYWLIPLLLVPGGVACQRASFVEAGPFAISRVQYETLAKKVAGSPKAGQPRFLKELGQSLGYAAFASAKNPDAQRVIEAEVARYRLILWEKELREEARREAADPNKLQKMYAIQTTALTRRKIRLSHIATVYRPGDTIGRVKAQNRIREAAQALGSGMAFREAVLQYSEDSHSRGKGGELGWSYLDVLPVEARDAIQSLQPGETSGIVAVTAGFRIFRLEENLIKKPSFAEVRSKLEQQLATKIFTGYQQASSHLVRFSMEAKKILGSAGQSEK